jgi:hypothetical protein
LIPRLLGHGGFASHEISVSYLDRNYGGSRFDLVLHHEMIHILDARLGGDLRPTMLVEGLAVYLTGGHFKPEPILSRAAALLKLPPPHLLGRQAGTSLANPGGQLTLSTRDRLPRSRIVGGVHDQFLGWEAFNKFYRDIHPHSPQPAHAIDTALQAHFVS